MKITLDVSKSIEENASAYFEKAKKAKKKIGGAEEAIEKFKKKLEKERLKEAKIEKKGKRVEKKERRWFEKFRWFITSEGILAIGGRDATTNEILIKKHTDPEDRVFHADMAGSPFVVLKCKGKKDPEIAKSIEEAAIFTATNSRAWRLNLSSLEVYHVGPEQVTKQAKAGEFMSKGSFMVYGKRRHIATKLECSVGLVNQKADACGEEPEAFEGKIMAGPESAVKKMCEKNVKVVQGKGKTSDIAKKINRKIGGDLDETVRSLPAGGVEMV